MKKKTTKVKLLKDFPRDGAKKGDIENWSLKDAEIWAKEGVVEILKERNNKIEKGLKNKKSETKSKQEPDYQGYDSFISDYVDKSSTEKLQAIEEGSNKFNITKTAAKDILNEKVQKIRSKESVIRKEKDEKLKIRRREFKEEKRAERKLEEDAQKILKKERIEELDATWENCTDDLFQFVSEEDWKKAKYYFVKRFLKENTYSINSDEDIVGIKTFKDNEDIIIYSEKEGIYIQDAEIHISSEIERRFGEKSTNMQVKEIVSSIKRQTYYDREELETQPKCLRPIGNGLWDIKGKCLLDFTPKYVFLNKINANYVNGAQCENFKRFLKEVLDTEEERLVLQEWLGYCLLNDVRFSKALLLFGDGENGKSVLLKCIKHFLGNNNVTSISLQYLESNPFAPVRLFGKIANIFADLPKKALGQTSVFKMAVAGDDLTGEKKGKDSFEFTPHAKMMFSCNEVPRTPDRTRGFFRRWIILKFNQHFPEGDPRRDENLFDKLKEDKEMEGILIFALEGLERLLSQKAFTNHMDMREIESFWIRQSDSVAAFILDIVEQDSQGETNKVLIYNTYESYCTLQGYPAEESNKFWGRFKEVVDYIEHKPKDDLGYQVRFIKGVKLKSLDSLSKSTEVIN